MNIIKIVTLALMASLLFLGCSGSSGAKKALSQYIDAVKAGDFDTVYKLNAITQKKVLLIHMGSEATRQKRLTNNFDEYNERFKSDPQTSDIDGIFMEKYIFPEDSSYKINDLSVDEVSGSPTPQVMSKKDSSATVAVEYPNRSTAPSYEDKKIKSATYGVLLIKGVDAVKGIKTDVKVSKWLFKDIYVMTESIIYW